MSKLSNKKLKKDAKNELNDALMTSIAEYQQQLKILDNMLEILFALGAGVISFLSPCVLPLIPGYIAYISGSTLNEILEKNTNILPIILFTRLLNSIYNIWCCFNFFRTIIT